MNSGKQSRIEHEEREWKRESEWKKTCKIAKELPHERHTTNYIHKLSNE